MARWISALSVVLAATAVADEAPIATETEAAITYSAPDECPTRSAFAAKFLQLRESGLGSLRATIRIEHAAAEYSLELITSRDGREEGRRTVSAASCEEVVSAGALILSLAATDAPETEPEPAVEPNSERPASAEEPGDTAEKRATPVADGPRLLPRVAAGLAIESGLLPSTALGPSVLIGASLARFSISARGFSYLPRRSEAGFSGANISAAGLELRLCGAPLAGGLTLEACLLGEGVRIRGEPFAVFEPRSRQTMMWSPGAAFSAQAQLWGPLWISVELAGVIRPRRTSFALDDTDTRAFTTRSFAIREVTALEIRYQ